MYNSDNITIGPAELFVDGVNVGWTKGGVSIRTTKSYWYRPSFDGLGDEEAVKESESYYISTILIENTLESLKNAWGIAESINVSAPPTKRLDFGGSRTVVEHVIRFAATNRRIIFYKAVAMDFGELAYQKSSESLIPITFRALLDTSKDVGEQVGYIMDGINDVYFNFKCRVTVTS